MRHNKLQRTVHLKNAQVRMAGIPILYLRRLRIPDPSLEICSGFLVPSIQSTSRLGTGVVVPYFIPIGTDKDITLTPDISPKTRMLEVGYWQIVNKKSFTFDDDIESASLRAYGRIVGRLNVFNGYKLGFTLQSVSDNAYVGDY